MRTYPVKRELIGVAGWILILLGASTWEILSLFDSHIATLSHQIRIVMNPAVGRAGLVLAWIFIGFALFGPKE
jgi:hypothetical protein